MKYTPVGVDIAKHLMQVHFIDEHTGEVPHRADQCAARLTAGVRRNGAEGPGVIGQGNARGT